MRLFNFRKCFYLLLSFNRYVGIETWQGRSLPIMFLSLFGLVYKLS